MKMLESQAELLRLQGKNNRSLLVGIKQGGVRIKVMEHGESGEVSMERKKLDMRYFKIPFCPLILNVICALSQVIAHQAPLSMRFSGQEYWSGLPFPSPGDFPDSGVESLSLASLVLAGGFFTTSST